MSRFVGLETADHNAPDDESSATSAHQQALDSALRSIAEQERAREAYRSRALAFLAATTTTSSVLAGIAIGAEDAVAHPVAVGALSFFAAIGYLGVVWGTLSLIRPLDWRGEDPLRELGLAERLTERQAFLQLVHDYNCRHKENELVLDKMLSDFRREVAVGFVMATLALGLLAGLALA